MKKIQCRTHGGYFSIEPRRGRPPVRCTEENPCTALSAVALEPVTKRKQTRTELEPVTRTVKHGHAAKIPDFRMMTLTDLRRYARENYSTLGKLTRREELIRALVAQVQKEQDAATEKAAREAMRVTSKASRINSEPHSEVGQPRFKPATETMELNARAATVQKAKRAKEELVAKGWDVQGKVIGNRAEIIATRDEEMLCAVWENGILVQPMQYSLWSTEKPSTNNKPASKLPFDPGEITDAELARILVGNKVTWYNRLGQREQSAICGKDSITIEHRINSTGDERPEERIIKFVDAIGNGFQAFRLDALLRVGK